MCTKKNPPVAFLGQERYGKIVVTQPPLMFYSQPVDTSFSTNIPKCRTSWKNSGATMWSCMKLASQRSFFDFPGVQRETKLKTHPWVFLCPSPTSPKTKCWNPKIDGFADAFVPFPRVFFRLLFCRCQGTKAQVSQKSQSLFPTQAMFFGTNQTCRWGKPLEITKV